jgi:CheY-like chemotaxis protein
MHLSVWLKQYSLEVLLQTFHSSASPLRHQVFIAKFTYFKQNITVLLALQGIEEMVRLVTIKSLLMFINTYKKQLDVTALRPPRILLIEDDRDTAEIVSTFMKMTGYACHVKAETRDIVELVHWYQPDLVLIDYVLPLINGGELCSEIKRDKDYGRLPVIIYSAYPKIFLSLGLYHCDAFIPKPFDLDDLQGKIAKILRKSIHVID